MATKGNMPASPSGTSLFLQSAGADLTGARTSPLGVTAAGTDGFKAFTPAEAQYDKRSWHAASSNRREMARRLAGDMRRRLKQYEDNEQATKALAMDFTEAEKQRNKEKALGRIEAHRSAVDESASLIQRIAAALGRLDDTAIKLKKERYERCTQLQVCQRRLKLRDGRPAPERVKDCLTLELEKEQENLLGIRAELLQRETGTRTQREKLAELRTQLSADTGSRRLQIEHETHFLKPTVLESMKPKEDPKDQDAGAREAAKRRENLSKIANRMLGTVQSFCDSSFQALHASQLAAAEMTEQITLTFAKRADELSTVRTGIEADLTSLSQTIDKAEVDLDKYTRRLDPADKEKGAIIASHKQLLRELKTTKEELVEDLHNKIKAKDCDDACLRVRPMNAFDLKNSQDMAKEAAAAIAAKGHGKGSVTNLRAGSSNGFAGANLGQSASSPSLLVK